MGNFMNKADTETINWNNLKTENMSSAHIGGFGLSNEAKQLISSFNVDDVMSSEASEYNLNSILGKINSNLSQDDQQKFEQILTKESGVSGEELSATSPFVSSDMYDYFVQKEQSGGANQKMHRAIEGDDSSTSSTSDSDDEDLLTTPESDVKPKKQKQHKTRSQQSTETEDDDNLSYLSSSAHTGGEFSSENEESESENVNRRRHKSKHESSSDDNSVNTSDINYVDDY
jgi:hypothetical protein